MSLTRRVTRSTLESLGSIGEELAEELMHADDDDDGDSAGRRGDAAGIMEETEDEDERMERSWQEYSAAFDFGDDDEDDQRPDAKPRSNPRPNPNPNLYPVPHLMEPLSPGFDWSVSSDSSVER